MRQTWKTAVSLVAMLALVGCGGKGKGSLPWEKEKPDPVVDAKEMDRPLFGDDFYELTVRNVGGAGKIRVEVEVSRDRAGRDVLASKSTVVYLAKGEEKRLRFNLGNVGTGTVWHSARAKAVD